MSPIDADRAAEKRDTTNAAICDALRPLMGEKGIVAVSVVSMVAVPEGVVPVVTLLGLNAVLIQAVVTLSAKIATGELVLHQGDVSLVPMMGKN